MIKKKYFILLSASLLVLLLGLSTTSYADVNNTWTENQLKNVIYNYLHPSYSDSYIESYFNYHATEITNLVNKMNSNKYVYIVFQRTGPSNFFIGYGNTDSIWYRSTGNGKLYMANSSGYNYWVMSFGNAAGWENSGYYSIDAFNMNYYYFSKTVYNNANATSVFFAGGMYPSTYWEGPYLDDHFKFDYNMNQTFKDIIVGNDTYTLPIREQGNNSLIELGTLEQLQFLDYILIEKMRYNKYTASWETFSAENIFEGEWGTDDDILTIKVSGGNIGNIMVQYTMYPKTDDFEYQTAFYYVVNNVTQYSGDYINVGGTFGNDDYYNNYDDNINDVEQNQQAQDRTDKVVDKMEELYNKMFTVSGEEIDKIISDTFENIQIESGEIAEAEAIMKYLKREPGDFVISWESMTTHFTINGQNTSQLTIPANQINFSQMERDSEELHQVMTWERRIVSLAIFGLLVHEAYILFMATLGVGTYIYGHKLEEKNTLKKQQDAQEERWRSKLEEQRYNEWLRGHRN